MLHNTLLSSRQLAPKLLDELPEDFSVGYEGNRVKQRHSFPEVDKSLVVRDSEYNGITDVASRTNTNKKRELESFMKIMQKNEPFDNYRSVQGLEYTPMMLAYFGKDNMRIVQNAIARGVFDETGKRIPYVNRYRLADTMFEEWEAKLPYNPRNATEDIRMLNDCVVQRWVPVAVKDVQFYMQGRERISTLPVNQFRPALTR